MRVLYWPRGVFDCTAASRAIEHPSIEHHHCVTDAEVVKLFDHHASTASRQWVSGFRYRCITGPGGLVRDVIE